MNIITSQRLRDVTAGFQTVFNKVMQDTPTAWAKVATKTTSTSSKEVYGWLKNTFGMKELIGEIEVDTIEASDYELVNKEFHDTKKVRESDLEDGAEGTYAPMFQMMGMGANRAYDEIVFERLGNGFTNKGYDGKAFFATNHPIGDKGGQTFSNKGTKKLSATNFTDAKTALKTVKAANGKAWGFGRTLLLVVHPKYEDTARHMLNDELTTGGESNVLRNSAQLEVNALLPSEDAWFLLEVGWPVKPIIMQERKAIGINSVNQPGDSYVVLNHHYLFQAFGRYNAGYGIPAMAWGSTGEDPA